MDRYLACARDNAGKGIRENSLRVRYLRREKFAERLDSGIVLNKTWKPCRAGDLVSDSASFLLESVLEASHSLSS